VGTAAVIEKARAVVGDQPIYVSVDVDGFDPALVRSNDEYQPARRADSI
jgi:arginase family enzyme